MEIIKLISVKIERYSAIFDFSRYYCTKDLRFVVMDFPYDVLRVLIILMALIMLLVGAFIMCVWFVFIYFILTYKKRNSLLYNIIIFFQSENQVSDEKTVFSYLMKCNVKNVTNDKVLELLGLLNDRGKIRKEGNMYFSNFSGPFKNKIINSSKSSREKI